MKKLQHVIKCKLIVTPNVAQELKATMREFAKACNLIAEIGFNGKLHRRYDLHHAAYNQAREQTNLPAQHAINAIAKVAEQFTREPGTLHTFKPLSTVRYDARTITFKRDFHEATLTVCPKGRVSGEIQTSAAMREKLRTWKIGSCDLIFRNGEFHLHVSINREAPEVPEPVGSLGIDLGVKRIAVASNNQFFTGKAIKHKKRLFQQTRSRLQANGSKRAKRTLKRVSGRERRYVTDSNHCISKQIIETAKANNQRIVLEDLTGIQRNAPRHMYKHLHGWSFAELRGMIAYKAAAASVEVAFGDPAYTSIGCSRCLHIGSRPTQSLFTCGHCGLRLCADINAARGIAMRHDLMAMGRYFCSLEGSQPAPKSPTCIERQAARL